MGFKVLAITDGPMCPTGYGVQANEILSRLVKRGWDVVAMANNYFGELELNAEGYHMHDGIKVVPNKQIWEGPQHLYGSKESIKALFERERPDVVWTFNDWYRVAGLTEIPEIVERWVHWMPVDAPNSHAEFLPWMNRVNYMVMCSGFAYRDLAPQLTGVRYKDAFYLGVSPDVFYPLGYKADIKRRHNYEGFGIITVGKNQPRKMIWKTAKVVGRFLETHPDAYWVVKSNPEDGSMNEEPVEVRDFRNFLVNVKDQVLIETKVLDPLSMNELYNSGDVFMHLSGGEGFGIPYVEAMLAGLPCILADNTTSYELTGGFQHGWGVKIGGKRSISNFGYVEYDEADEEDAYRQLELAYTIWKNDPNGLTNMGLMARNFAVRWCDPEIIADRWEGVFHRIIRARSHVLWHSFFGRGVGFSAVSEAIIPELEKLGYDMYVNDWQSGASPILKPYFKGLYEKYLAARGRIDFGDQPQIDCWLMESFDSIKGKWKLGWSLVESTKLRPFYQQMCNKMDYLITSSEHNKAVQKASGITADIRIVPPCTSVPFVQRTGVRGPFTFLHVGVVQERKNPEMALDGYCMAFPDDGRTKFVLKSNHFGTLEWFQNKYGHRKDVEFIYTDEKPLTDEEMLALYGRADCYVNLSHGEGIGMPDLEAMASGLPVIGLAWDTRGLFLNESTGYPVAVKAMVKAYPSLGDECGEWAEPSLDDYIARLKEVVERPEEARSKGKEGSELVHKLFTPQRAAAALDAVLLGIEERKSGRYALKEFGEDYYTKVHKYDAGFYEGAAQVIRNVTDGAKGKVLDIGCGTGYLMKHLLRHGVDVVGVDASSYAVEHPLPECKGRVSVANATNLPFRDAEFDLGVSWAVMEHIPEKDVLRVLSEMARTCCRVFFQIAMPLRPGDEARLASEDPTHITLKPIEWWKEKLATVGMEIVGSDGGYCFVAETKYHATLPIVKGDRVLVGIPTKDRLDYLTKLMESLDAQTFKDFDVMIVDDSRTQHLPEHQGVCRMMDVLQSHGHNTLACRGVSQNQAVAHNKMLAHALRYGYKLVFRCDDDITLEPDFLATVMERWYADTKTEFAAIGGVFLDPNQPRHVQVMPEDWQRRIEFQGKIEPCVLHAQILQYPEGIAFREVEHLYSSYFYRPELVSSVGGFATDLTAMGYREETLPIYELFLKGFKVGFSTQAIGYHWNAPSGGLRSIKPEDAARMVQVDEGLFQTRLRLLWKKYGRN